MVVFLHECVIKLMQRYFADFEARHAKNDKNKAFKKCRVLSAERFRFQLVKRCRLTMSKTFFLHVVLGLFLTFFNFALVFLCKEASPILVIKGWKSKKDLSLYFFSRQNTYLKITFFAPKYIFNHHFFRAKIKIYHFSRQN